MASERENQQGETRPTASRERRSQKSGGASDRPQADSAPSIPRPDAASAPRTSPSQAATRLSAPARQASLSGATVECVLEPSGSEPARALRGVICRINSMGLMAAFEDRCAEGRHASVRFDGGGESFSLPGRILRVQQPASTPDGHPVYHHLIRFEGLPAETLDRLQTVVG